MSGLVSNVTNTSQQRGPYNYANEGEDESYMKSALDMYEMEKRARPISLPLNSCFVSI